MIRTDANLGRDEHLRRIEEAARIRGFFFDRHNLELRWADKCWPVKVKFDAVTNEYQTKVVAFMDGYVG